jgi:hypothetical protein
MSRQLEWLASTATVSRLLNTMGIDRRKMKKIPKLTKVHKTKRYEHALAHCDPHFDWSKWIWTDEKKFNLDGPDGYNYYWHVKGMEPLRYSSNASSKKSVMIWCGISKCGQTGLVKVHGRLNRKNIVEYFRTDYFLHTTTVIRSNRIEHLAIQAKNVRIGAKKGTSR